MNLHHLHLHVQNLASAEHFYRDWFDMKIIRSGGNLTFLTDARGFDLALMQDASVPAMPSWFHFGFRLPSSDAVLDLHSRMSTNGIRIVKPLYRDELFASFRCADSDDYIIEVYWEGRNDAVG